MNKKRQSFVKSRVKGALIAFKGAYLFVTTEPSGMVQFALAVLLVVAGFYFDISLYEWTLQIISIGMVLTAEALNTAIEKLCDFVHEEHHERIGFIKDISSGAVWFAAMTALALIAVIYLPKLMG